MTDKDEFPPLSDKARKLLELALQYDDPTALFADHPEITMQDLQLITDEVQAALQELELLPDGKGPAIGKNLPKHAKHGRSKSVGDAYQLKMTLHGSKPPIWRRLVVPADINLSVLHKVFQIAMGWHGGHLHCFEINGETFQPTDPDIFNGEPAEDESQYCLCDLINVAKARFNYQYDFGDDWQHHILVEEIIPASAHPTTMVCLAGKGRCPPEDCGGIYEYYHLLKVLRDPHHKQYKELLEWIGTIPDPDEFDSAEVSACLAQIG